AASRAVFCQEAGHLVVVVDRTQGRNCSISPAMVLDEFAAAVSKGPQVRVVRVEHGSCFLVGKLEVAVKVQCMVVPLQIFEDNVGIEGISEHELKRSPWRGSGNPQRPIARDGFGAGCRAREYVFASARIRRSVIDFSQCVDLRTGQTIRSIAILAFEDRWIEMAASWIFDNAILYAVDCVTSIEDCFLYCGQLVRRNKAGRALIQGLRIPDSIGKQSGPEVGRRSGDDTIEIGWIPLSLH